MSLKYATDDQGITYILDARDSDSSVWLYFTGAKKNNPNFIKAVAQGSAFKKIVDNKLNLSFDGDRQSKKVGIGDVIMSTNACELISTEKIKLDIQVYIAKNSMGDLYIPRVYFDWKHGSNGTMKSLTKFTLTIDDVTILSSDSEKYDTTQAKSTSYKSTNFHHTMVPQIVRIERLLNFMDAPSNSFVHDYSIGTCDSVNFLQLGAFNRITFDKIEELKIKYGYNFIDSNMTLDSSMFKDLIDKSSVIKIQSIDSDSLYINLIGRSIIPSRHWLIYKDSYDRVEIDPVALGQVNLKLDKIDSNGGDVKILLDHEFQDVGGGFVQFMEKLCNGDMKTYKLTTEFINLIDHRSTSWDQKIDTNLKTHIGNFGLSYVSSDVIKELLPKIQNTFDNLHAIGIIVDTHSSFQFPLLTILNDRLYQLVNNKYHRYFDYVKNRNHFIFACVAVIDMIYKHDNEDGVYVFIKRLILSLASTSPN